MRENRIIVEPFGFLSYISVEGIRELNQHGFLRITGLIEDRNVKDYQSIAEEEPWVYVKAVNEDNVEAVWFCGILTQWEVRVQNGGHILTIELKTGSFLLDLTPHIRSFQKENFPFSNIMEECLALENGLFLMLDQAHKQSESFLLQYRETDWEFFLRLVGYAGCALIPEYDTPGKKFYFGYRREETREIQTDHYDFIRDIGAFKQKEAAGVKGLVSADAGRYVIRSREWYGLGETVSFQGRRFVVAKALSRLEGSELYHEYHLSTRLMGYALPRHNHKMSGISLNAYVVNVAGTKVQVRIREDENQENAGYHWFDYATVYSTPDGTGWYCMPEAGDEVRLSFPDAEEKNAYVVSSIHLEGAVGRDNPDHKSWKNRQNKEILFTPDSLIMRNNKGLLLELSDQEGIKLISDKEIVFQAAKDISIASNGGVSVSGDSRISLVQGSAKIDMTDTISIGGGKIFMN